MERNNKGWRTIQADLQEYHDINVNHKKLRRLMHKLGIRGILPKKNTSKSDSQHYIANPIQNCYNIDFGVNNVL